ncbi:MAG: discoidin domain-containing protein [Planctomycetaceae bacterium]|nr:discoidin domain-containing protein [Planctomycetaceae bacterium]
MRTTIFILLCLATSSVFGAQRKHIQAEIQADWLEQAESWRQNPSGQANSASLGVKTSDDAAGAVDGVKNGLYAFHTGQEPNPWWSVDLQKNVSIGRIVVYNRLDYEPGLHNADNLVILTSSDNKNWTKVYANPNKFFGGVAKDGVKEGPLDIQFDPPIDARYVKLTIPSDKPIFFHLDEVEIYSAGEPDKNIALHCPANQSSLSPWSVRKPSSLTQQLQDKFPTKEYIERGKKLAAFLNNNDAMQKFSELEKRPHADESQEVYFEVRGLIRDLAFSNPLLDFDQLLFVKRYTQQTYPDICLNHMPWVSRPGGDICVLDDPFQKTNRPPGQVRNLIADQLGPGHVRGIDLHWDGQKIVFGFAPQKDFPFSPEQKNWPPPGCGERLIGHQLRCSQEPIHIYEIDVNGTNINQVTNDSLWSDLDPAYLPNDEIVFVSDRCGFSLQCNNGPFHDETSCNLYTVKPDGTGLRWLSYNKDGDYMPHVLEDGTIGYCRWEYQERGWATIQSVWYIRPDGTGADALFKQHLDNPWALENTREIPHKSQEARQFVSIAAAHHTLPVGPVTILTPSIGLNSPDAIKIVTPGSYPPEGGMSGTPVDEGGVPTNGGYFQHPWPLSNKFFLVAYTYSNDHPKGMPASFRGNDETGYALYLIDVFGNKELIYRDPEISSVFPMPLKARKRPPILPDNRDPELGNRAVCTVSDITFGVDDVDRSEVKYLRVARRIGWPYTEETGGQRYEVDGSGWGLSWAPALIFGEVPVEEDGSVSFYVPSDVSVYFQLLDKDKREIKRMRSFISFQPGERRSCVGCHETRSVAPTADPPALAMKQEPITPTPPPWGIERPINFLVDVQPVLDKHCVSCHTGLNPAGGIDFSPGLTAPAPMKTPYRSYNFDGLNRAYRTMIEKNLVTFSNKHDPASAIAKTREFGSTKSKVIDRILSGKCGTAIQPGTEDWYRLTTWIDANAQYHDRFVNSRPVHPPYDFTVDKELIAKITAVHEKRCTECHNPVEVSRLDWINLKHPSQSLFLAAPLPSGKCSRAIYESENDADYKTLLEIVNRAVEKAKQFPRRDLETFYLER